MALAKVRALHPDFFSDEDVSEVSIPARLLFAGMWCFACDNGHLADKPKQIKRWIYATDDVNTAELLRELAAENLIERAEGWISIPGLKKRQRIDHRYFKACDRDGCEKPGKADSERGTRRGNGGATQSHVVPTRGPATDGDGVGEGDSDGEGEVTTSPAATASAKKPAKRSTSRPVDFRPTQAHIDLAAERGVDLHAEWAKFCDWCDANGKTYKDWSAGLRTWIRNARPSIQVAGQPTRVQQHLALAQKLAAEEQQVIPFRQIGS